MVIVGAIVSCYGYRYTSQLLWLQVHKSVAMVTGTQNLHDLLAQREEISHSMQSSLDEATDPWGIKVERVEM